VCEITLVKKELHYALLLQRQFEAAACVVGSSREVARMKILAIDDAVGIMSAARMKASRS
jgi:hypothetical protein